MIVGNEFQNVMVIYKLHHMAVMAVLKLHLTVLLKTLEQGILIFQAKAQKGFQLKAVLLTPEEKQILQANKAA